MIVDWSVDLHGNNYYSSGHPIILSYAGTIPVPFRGGGSEKREHRNEDELILLVAKAFIQAIN